MADKKKKKKKGKKNSNKVESEALAVKSIQKTDEPSEEVLDLLYKKKTEFFDLVIKLHKPIGIHFLYNENYARPVRYCSYYMKLCV